MLSHGGSGGSRDSSTIHGCASTKWELAVSGTILGCASAKYELVVNAVLNEYTNKFLFFIGNLFFYQKRRIFWDFFNGDLPCRELVNGYTPENFMKNSASEKSERKVGIMNSEPDLSQLW